MENTDVCGSREMIPRSVMPRLCIKTSGVCACVFLISMFSGCDRTSERESAECRSFVRSLYEALYRLDKGQAPESGNNNLVRALSERTPGGNVYYEMKKSTLDSQGRALDVWGTPLIYRNNREDLGEVEARKLGPAREYDIYSCGPNRIDERGEGDDIRSWR